MTEKNTLLIVDDYDFNRRLLREIFPDYEVIEAENGLKAIDKYETHKDEICAVLADIMMPVLDGFGMLEYFSSHRYTDNVPVFMISADNSPKSLQKAFALGAQNVINKSVNHNFLKKQIEDIIELYRLRKLCADSDALSKTQNISDICENEI